MAIDHLDLEGLSPGNPLDPLAELQVGPLRPGDVAKGLISRTAAVRAAVALGSTRIRVKSPIAEAASAARRAGRPPRVSREVQRLAGRGHLADHRASQGGRAGTRVVFRLIEELHGAGQAVVELREPALDAAGQLGVGQPRGLRHEQNR